MLFPEIGEDARHLVFLAREAFESVNPTGDFRYWKWSGLDSDVPSRPRLTQPGLWQVVLSVARNTGAIGRIGLVAPADMA